MAEMMATTEKVVTAHMEDDGDWNKIKEEIICSICYELFTDPRTLACLHTFCKSCIQTSVDTGLAEVPEGYLECPLCRAHIPLPANGIDGISANFSTKRLIDIYRKRREIATDTSPKCRTCSDGNSATMWCIECDCPICSECTNSHRRMKIFSQHKIIQMKEFTSDPKRAIEVSLNPGACPSHPDQVLKFYCYTCDQTICVECAILDHPRGEHKFDSISKIIVAEKEEVLKTAAPLEPMRVSVCEAMNRVAASKDDITTRYQVNMTEVNSLFDELHQILDQQREVILKKLDLFKTNSHKSLDIQNSDLSFLESKLRSCREFVHNLIDKSSATEILSFKTQIAGRVADLTSLMEQAPLEPVCTADSTVWCIDPAKFVTMCKSVCHVFCSPYPPNCTIEKPTRHYIQVDGILVNGVTVTISLKDSHGNSVPKQAQHLRMSDQVSYLMVKEQDKDGVYKMTYRPVGIEAQTVIIKWSGHDITKCDIPGLVRDYTTLRVDIPEEEEGKEEENIHNDGSSDDSNDHNGQFKQTLVTYGPDNENIGEVSGLANGPNDELIISDLDNNQVIVFDKDLQYSHTIGEKGDGQGQFLNVRGVACDDTGQLFVEDCGNHRIQVFKLSGQFIAMFEIECKGEGEFDGPNELALSSTGLLFVGDSGHHHVKVFDTKQDNKFLYNFGQDKLLHNYICLSLNATEDKLFVVDGGSSVKVFTPQGQFLHSLLPDPSQCGTIPLCITCTPDGHLLVAALLSTRFLSVYHEDGTVVITSDREWNPLLWLLDKYKPNINCTTTAVLMRKNGQIVIGFHNYSQNDQGVVLL